MQNKIKPPYSIIQLPPPVPSDGPAIADLVVADLRMALTDHGLLQPHTWSCSQLIPEIEARKQLGIERYGVALQANNGRDPLIDLYQELLDAAKYSRQYLHQKQRGEPSVISREFYQDLADKAGWLLFCLSNKYGNQ